MTTKEFSDAFDTLLNSYSVSNNFGDSPSIGGIVLDEYEKSLFLTQAQEQIIIELYTGRNDKYNSFEGTEELRAYLRDLIKTDNPSESKEELKGLSKYSKFFVLPDDVLFITYESATLADEDNKCIDGSEIVVTPVTQDDLNRVMNNPFKMASERRALRLDYGFNIVEIISKYNIKDYTIRYLSRPTPIILGNFEGEQIDGVSIHKNNKITECKLNPAMHRIILERAVALALSSRSIQSK